jgi:modulator of FtsH protease
MEGWENFLAAQAGASATLTGLLFVGVSINLNRILSIRRLPYRALEALLLLAIVLVVSSLLLVPGQPARLVGIEVLSIGLCAWLAVTTIDVRMWRVTKAEYRWSDILPTLINQIATVCYVAAGISILLFGFSGLYWLVPAILLSFVEAVIDAWVLLVEINR